LEDVVLISALQLTSQFKSVTGMSVKQFENPSTN